MLLRPRTEAARQVTSSGSEVPPATTVMPMSQSLTPTACATKRAESTIMLPPSDTATNPATSLG